MLTEKTYPSFGIKYNEKNRDLARAFLETTKKLYPDMIDQCAMNYDNHVYLVYYVEDAGIPSVTSYMRVDSRKKRNYYDIKNPFLFTAALEAFSEWHCKVEDLTRVCTLAPDGDVYSAEVSRHDIKFKLKRPVSGFSLNKAEFKKLIKFAIETGFIDSHEINSPCEK